MKKLNRYGDAAIFLDKVALRLNESECIMWPFERNPKGYGRHKVGGRRLMAHRLVCESVYGPCPTKLHNCAHSCGKGHLGCVNPKHLRWATQKENCADKQIHGTIANGEKNGNVSMTEATARKVKLMIGTTTQVNIAAALGITRSAVRDIKIGRSWAWL